jgi:hypothetical protein
VRKQRMRVIWSARCRKFRIMRARWWTGLRGV